MTAAPDTPLRPDHRRRLSASAGHGAPSAHQARGHLAGGHLARGHLARDHLAGGHQARDHLARGHQAHGHQAGGFTLIELLVVVSIIGVTVALSSFSVTIFDDFKVTEQANAVIDEIVHCREEAIYLGSVCSVHIENEKTKRDIRETLLGRRVLIGGVEYRHAVIPYNYKVTASDDTTFDIYASDASPDKELDLVYPRNIDITGEKDPLVKQGVIQFYPDASYTPFVIKMDITEAEQIVYLHGDGNALPEISDENPLLTY